MYKSVFESEKEFHSERLGFTSVDQYEFIQLNTGKRLFGYVALALIAKLPKSHLTLIPIWNYLLDTLHNHELILFPSEEDRHYYLGDRIHPSWLFSYLQLFDTEDKHMHTSQWNRIMAQTSFNPNVFRWEYSEDLGISLNLESTTHKQFDLLSRLVYGTDEWDDSHAWWRILNGQLINGLVQPGGNVTIRLNSNPETMQDDNSIHHFMHWLNYQAFV